MVDTSWVSRTRRCSAAHARSASSSIPVRPASCARTTSISGFPRNNARRMSLLKFSPASQRNATPAAGQSIDRGSPPAAKWTHWIFWSRECPGAAAPGRAPGRTHAADNIQLPDMRRPARSTDTAGRSPPRSHPRQTQTTQSPALPSCRAPASRRRRRTLEVSVRSSTLPPYVQPSADRGSQATPTIGLKNFRGMWQGVTEGNLVRVLNPLKALSPLAVIVEEADAQLGNRSSGGDSGVGNRVFAQIAAFMDNTELLGKVIWFLLTCRPDFLPVDLKRQGRAEEHIALFYPDTEEERTALVRAMLKKSGTQVSAEAERCFVERSVGLSGADIEAVLTRARMQCALANAPAVGPDDVKGGPGLFCPPPLPPQNRIAEPGGGSGVGEPQIAAAEVPRRGSHGNH